MRRIKKLAVVVVTVAVATLVAPISPAMAQETQELADATVFFPYGNGATYSCAGDPPFVFDAAGTGNCTVQQIGSSAGSLCEVPTTITFVHHEHQWAADATICR
jgi:hypothetical protein